MRRVNNFAGNERLDKPPEERSDGTVGAAGQLQAREQGRALRRLHG